MAKLSRSFVTPAGGADTNLHPRESIIGTGTLGALNAELIVPADGASSFSLDLRGTFNITAEVSGTVDGTNWVALPTRAVVGANVTSYFYSIVGSSGGIWAGRVGPYRSIRVRCTGYTSGAATAVLVTSTADIDANLQDGINPLLVTATGAVSAAVTLTLPAPGVALRHYLSYISAVRFNASGAALTAATAPVILTTTNLPGNPVLQFSADALAPGASERVREDFNYPLAAVTQNTATTVVAPLTTGVIWRIQVGYYVAP